MKIKRILITGDDGYNSAGIRSLARILKDKYELKIAATLNQQSGTGGLMNLTGEISWGEEIIEGVEALWIDGSPVDSMEVAQGYYKKHFDLVISGINYGENLSYSLVSSGTFSAAVRALGINLAPKAIVMSWQTIGSNFLIKHDGKYDISKFVIYPGGEARKIIETIIENDFFGKELVNVNFPANPTSHYKLVRPAKDITKLWRYPLTIDKERKISVSPKGKGIYSDNVEGDIETDVGALHKGFITLTPLNYLT